MYSKPLVRQGIASVILMIPYYDRRRDVKSLQRSSSLPYVEDNAAQAVGCAWEAVALFHYLRKDQSFTGPIVFAGASFGGSMAILSSLSCIESHGFVSIAGSSGPRQPFIEGLLKDRVHPDVDRTQLDAALSLVQLDSLASPHAVRREGHIAFATHDHIVSRDEAMRLANQMRRLCGKHLLLTTQEVSGGHGSTLLLRQGLLIDGVIDVIERLEKS
jgi:hypothetical protein